MNLDRLLNFKYNKIIMSIIFTNLYLFLAINTNTPFITDTLSILVITTLVLSSSYLFLDIIKKPFMRKYLKVNNFISFIILTLFVNFMAVGQHLFLLGNRITVNFTSLLYYILSLILLVPIITFFIYFFEKASNKILQTKINVCKHDIFKIRIIVFLITFTVFLIALIGFYPATMTSDSFYQWLQAVGVYDINTAHSALMTIFMRLVIMVCDNPFAFALIQITLFSSVVSFFLSYLYKYGLPKKIVIIIAILISVSPSNYMMITTIWKDVIYTTSLLWLTFFFVKIIFEKDDFYKKWYNVVGIIFSFILVYFFRHNGVGPIIFGMIFLVFYSIKKHTKEYLLISIATITLIIFINSFVFSAFNVKKISITGENTMFIHLLSRSSGLVLQSHTELPLYTKVIINRFGSDFLLKKHYNPFSGENYNFNPEFIEYRSNYIGQKQISNTDFFKSYSELFLKYPDIIIKERLDGTNIMWSFGNPVNGYNARYASGLWIAKYTSKIEWDAVKKISNDINENQAGYPKNNLIANKFLYIASISESKLVVDSIVWRSGIYFAMLIILCFYIINKKIETIWFLIPIIGNTATWLIFFTYQTFRYVWYIQIIAIFVILSVIVYDKSKNITTRNLGGDIKNGK